MTLAVASQRVLEMTVVEVLYWAGICPVGFEYARFGRDTNAAFAHAMADPVASKHLIARHLVSLDEISSALGFLTATTKNYTPAIVVKKLLKMAVNARHFYELVENSNLSSSIKNMIHRMYEVLQQQRQAFAEGREPPLVLKERVLRSLRMCAAKGLMAGEPFDEEAADGDDENEDEDEDEDEEDDDVASRRGAR